MKKISYREPREHREKNYVTSMAPVAKNKEGK
jgi:hypothetical protein